MKMKLRTVLLTSAALAALTVPACSTVITTTLQGVLVQQDAFGDVTAQAGFGSSDPAYQHAQLGDPFSAVINFDSSSVDPANPNITAGGPRFGGAVNPFSGTFTIDGAPTVLDVNGFGDFESNSVVFRLSDTDPFLIVNLALANAIPADMSFALPTLTKLAGDFTTSRAIFVDQSGLTLALDVESINAGGGGGGGGGGDPTGGDPTAVPEPGSLVLLGTAGALVRARRRCDGCESKKPLRTPRTSGCLPVLSPVW